MTTKQPWLPKVEREPGKPARRVRVPLAQWRTYDLRRFLTSRSSEVDWWESTEAFGAGVDEIREELQRRGLAS